MARKRTRNSEALVEADDDEKGDKMRGANRASGSGEGGGKVTTKAVPAGVEICFTEANCIANGGPRGMERQKNEEKTVMLAMVRLLVVVAKPNSYPHSHKLIMESLRSIRRFLSGLQLHSFVLQGLLAAMPALLAHKEKSIVVRSMGLLGDMALNSYQSVTQIANEEVVLHILLSFLSSTDIEVQKEACHTVANIASSTQGQRTLCEIGAVQKLMRLLFLVAGLTMNSVGLVDIFPDKSFKQSQAALLSRILEALDILTCDNIYESLGGIPEEARMWILKGLQVVWKRLRDNRHPLLQGDYICVLSKMIVFLTMEQEIHDERADDDHEHTVKLLFGGSEVELKHFWDDHWEHFPVLMGESVTGSEVHARLLRTWLTEGDSFVLKGLLTRTLACPPFSSDALDTIQIYKEIEKILGKRMIFGQDIRLVKYVCADASTGDSMHAAEELDYHKVGSGANLASSDKNVCIYADVQTCADAYEAGYTIALRGLEFRCLQIAEITEALAICFGQATVGANLYMTPTNSQGFRPHYDDHCVLVWQLTGSKAWKLWAPKVLLPRLYSQEQNLRNQCTDEERACRVLLTEGNLLYIPRGFPHAASTWTQAWTQATEMHSNPFLQCSQVCTKAPFDSNTERYFESVNSFSMAHAESGGCFDMQEHALDLPTLAGLYCCTCLKKWEDTERTIQKDSGPSLHITFGVEVEPPFDWEGFTHMALHCWAEDQNWDDILGSREFGGAWQSDLYKGLLHVAIRQCADKCSAFRKACLVAAQPICKEVHNMSRFQSLFKILLQNVAQTAAFKEALDAVLTAIDTTASAALDWMHWLRHLSGTHQASAWIDPVVFFHDSLTSSSSLDGLKDMEVKFTKAKERFVSHASYTDTHAVFIALLHKYRSARKRSTNGMLALQT